MKFQRQILTRGDGKPVVRYLALGLLSPYEIEITADDDAVEVYGNIPPLVENEAWALGLVLFTAGLHHEALKRKPEVVNFSEPSCVEVIS